MKNFTRKFFFITCLFSIVACKDEATTPNPISDPPVEETYTIGGIFKTADNGTLLDSIGTPKDGGTLPAGTTTDFIKMKYLTPNPTKNLLNIDFNINKKSRILIYMEKVKAKSTLEGAPVYNLVNIGKKDTLTDLEFEPGIFTSYYELSGFYDEGYYRVYIQNGTNKVFQDLLFKK